MNTSRLKVVIRRPVEAHVVVALVVAALKTVSWLHAIEMVE
jgi:hypothetical protein